MSSDDRNGEAVGSEAAELFAHYLKRRASGEILDFESFVLGHPGHTKALRIFHSLHAQTVELVSSESFAALVKRELGGDVGTPVCLDEVAATVPGVPPASIAEHSVASLSGKRRYSVRGELGQGCCPLFLLAAVGADAVLCSTSPRRWFRPPSCSYQ